MLITVIQDEVHVYRYNKDKTLCWLSKKVHLHTTEEALWFITCVGNLTFDAPVHARLSKFISVTMLCSILPFFCQV